MYSLRGSANPRTLFKSTISGGAGLALLLLGGCDPAPVATTDAGADAAPFACTSNRVVEGVLGQTTDLMFDTSSISLRPRDLGLACANPDPGVRWAPQEVIEYRVPGNARDLALTVSTVNSNTADNFNTVIQVRQSCESVPADQFPPTCFDMGGADDSDLRAEGGLTVDGGDVLYFLVTGYRDPDPVQGLREVDRGPIRVSFRLYENSPPTLTRAQFIAGDVMTRVWAEGSDPDGDAVGLALRLYRGTTLLDVNGDDEADENDVFTFFNLLNTSTTNGIFRGSRDLDGPPGGGIGAIVRVNEVDRIGVSLYDRSLSRSNEILVAVDRPTRGIGASCDSFAEVCAFPQTCNAGVCELAGDSESITRCAAAMPLSVTLSDVRTTFSGAATTVEGGGVLQAQCGPDLSWGDERLFSFTIASGVYDLSVTAQAPDSAPIALYVRSACTDATTERACAIGTGTPVTVTAANLGPGTYVIAGELAINLLQDGQLFPPSAVPGGVAFSISGSLTPVLTAGQTCDPAGVMNRCDMGACSGGVCPGVVQNDAGSDGGDAGVDGA